MGRRPGLFARRTATNLSVVDPLPYVDEHAQALRVGVKPAFDAVAAVTRALAERRLPRLFVRVWDAETGFAVAELVPPERVVLRGSHRFSTYELAFLVNQTPQGTIVRARTSATFPRLRGKLYRSLVIGSGGHVLAVRLILRSIARRAAA
jgi:hypothetical protein